MEVREHWWSPPVGRGREMALAPPDAPRQIHEVRDERREREWGPRARISRSVAGARPAKRQPANSRPSCLVAITAASTIPKQARSQPLTLT